MRVGRCTAAEQLGRDEEADLDPAAGDERNPAGQVGGHPALGVVERGAGRAELVVVVVDLLVCETEERKRSTRQEMAAQRVLHCWGGRAVFVPGACGHGFGSCPMGR